MSQLTQITLGKTTYYPVRVDAQGIAHLRARGETVAESATMSVQVRPATKNGVTKVTIRIAKPYWVQSKANTGSQFMEIARSEVVFTLPKNATTELRDNMLQETLAALGVESVQNGVKLLESLF